jgi:chemotaxis protein MotA
MPGNCRVCRADRQAFAADRQDAAPRAARTLPVCASGPVGPLIADQDAHSREGKAMMPELTALTALTPPDWKTFLDPLAIALIGGGTLVATVLHGTARDAVNAFAALPRLLRPMPFDFGIARAEIAAVERVNKDKPLLAIDPETLKDRDIRAAVAAITDGATPDAVERLLAKARADRRERHALVQDFWASAAEIAPAMGMIGTLFGLIRMFARMDDPASIGAAMAVALLSTLYGALLANLVAAPIAARFRRLSRIEEIERMGLVVPLRALAARQTPVVVAVRQRRTA